MLLLVFRTLVVCTGYTSYFLLLVCRGLSTLSAGAIPASLGNMITARKIFLNNNSIEGTIPSSLGNLSNLQVKSAGANARQLKSNAHDVLGND